MDDQGGAGGVPLHHDEDEAKRRGPHVDHPEKERLARSGEPQDRRSGQGGKDRGSEGSGPAKNAGTSGPAKDRGARSPAKGPE
ncbi:MULTISPECIES: hypothetical protein [unclassified Streptomyces]|uniref:hypothetical protein n=1 Tax=unclassified Streptomyces TaxID=2593676 RepID=UPI002E32AC25|nr:MULTISPECIES: hypothetical protein [unclassified Streptomyces]